ncbi:hypothetical protein EJB05_16631 [Eragrostis curvula]|uniref:Glycosyltransferase n=1 Tax=Eragrostis curvula TaxID=38414 RepID=A0A5J9VIF5_9POAL|nr:hypothetical protein EJB05_16631 [Eragrostis curvula]
MATAAAARHVVAVPFPGRGHINPMLVVCRLLAAADSSLTITVVVTEEWQGLLASAGVPPTLPERVRLATIPNVIPSEHGRGADHAGFIEAVHAKMGEPVERLLDQMMLERKPEAIVADTYLTWGVAAGARRGIPVCSLWTMPATFFLALYLMDRWPPADDSEGEEVKCSDIKIFRTWKLQLKRTAEVFSNVRKAQCVLFTSFYELEASAIDALSQVVSYPAYAVGPSIPHVPLGGESGDTEKIHHEDHIKWLDAQPKNSVLYVSFGSFVSLSFSQLDEFAMGLLDSGKNENGTVNRAAVSAAVTKLVDLGDGDSQEMRRRAEKLCQASRSAIREGGSSWCSLSDFVEDIIKGRLNSPFGRSYSQSNISEVSKSKKLGSILLALPPTT